MKWAITIDELAERVDHNEFYSRVHKKAAGDNSEVVRLINEDEINSHYLVAYNSPTELKGTCEFKIWFDQQIPPEYTSDMKVRTAQINYELFVGGWIQYHDSWVLHGVIEHTVYFDWTEKTGCVVVYLKTDYLTGGHPLNAKKDGGFVNPPTSTDPPKPPGPPPPPSYR
jgi:hypothetical protein